MAKGITEVLRNLARGEQISVTDMERSDLHRIASRVGIKIKCEKFVGGFIVTRVDKPFVSPRERANNEIAQQLVRQQAEHQRPERFIPAALAAELGHWADPNPEPIDNWQFTKDKPQFADDGNVYRQQKLAPDFKKSRTVRVDEDDHEMIIG